MKRTLAVFLAACAAAGAQEPPAFRASAEEVLVDFIVRDRRGRQVTDLRIEELELLEDGVPQTLKILRRIEGLRAIERPAGEPMREQRLDPSRNVQLMLIVFDRLSTEGRALARRAVEDLMKQGIPPNTYYAVATLEPSFKIVQPFTNEPYLVKWAAERATGAKAVRAEGAPEIGRPTRVITAGDYAAQAMEEAVAEMEGRLAELEREQRGSAALNGLLSMVLGLRRLEGRKNAIVFSEGIPGSGALARNVIAQANRNNVAFYTVDARGLRGGGALPAATDPSLPPSLAPSQAPLLEELAAETGGLAAADTNDLRAPLRQAAEDAGAYYLASYTPQNTHWDGRFRKLELRVKRAGVTVQARSGYFALPPGMQALLFPHEVPLLRALSSNPMPRQVNYRAGMFRFGPAPQGKVQCAFQIEIPIRELSVRRNEAAGTYDVHASFLVFVKDTEGRAVRKATRDVPFSGPLDKLAAFQAGDFIYNDHFPLPPGRYVMESAVADRLGERVGTRRVAFVVPAVREDDLSLSSLVLVKRVEASPPEEVRYGEGDDRGPNPLRFSGGMVTPALENTVRERLGVYFTIHAPQGGTPAAVIEILKDGTAVSRAEASLAAEGSGRFSSFSEVRLENAPAGDYELRVAVTSAGRTSTGTRGFTVAP
jgi:VWFA-related protein